MAQFNTYANISDLVNVVYADSLIVARENSVMPALVTVLTDLNGMAVRKNAKYSQVTINEIGESDDMTSQAFTPSVDQTLTPVEYGAQFFLTDQRLETDPWAVRSDAAIELGRGIGSKIDTLLVSNFASLTAGTTDGTGTNMAWANFFSALTKLRAAYAPLPYVCVMHPYQWFALGTAIAPGVTVTNAPMLQDQFVQNFFVGNVSGVDIYLDGNITSGTACKAAMFSRNAIALDTRRAPRIEPERDTSRRGWELNLSAVFAHGVWRPQYGVLISTAGTAPL